MAPRYTGWANIQLFGDQLLASKYIAEARGYLGDLFNRLQLGGLDYGSWSVQNQAGVRFQVLKQGTVPIIRIDVRSVTQPRGQAALIEGFICFRHSDASDLHAPHDRAIVDPLQAYRVFFYDATDLPDPPGSAGVFSVDTNRQPMFMDGTIHSDPITHLPLPPHVDGLANSGNVDWRNGDESLICTWVGPSARYVGAGAIVDPNSYSPYVFIHAQQVFDCTVLSSGGFFGDTSDYATDYAGRGGIIIGAALARMSGQIVLLAVVRLGTNNVDGLTAQPRRTEHLVRLGLTTADPRRVGLPLASVWQLTPAIDPSVAPTSSDHYAGAPLILWTRELSTAVNEDVDVRHPWFFNQSATEARCVRSTNQSVIPIFIEEHLLKLDADLAHAAVTVMRHPTTNTVTDSSDNLFTGTLDGTVTDATTGLRYHPDLGHSQPNNLCWGEYSTGRHFVQTQSTSLAWQLAYVDYRDDVPVYAYLRNNQFSQTIDSTVEVAGDSSTVLGTPLVSGPSTFQPFTTTQDWSVTVTSRTRYNGIRGGIQTDWMELEAEQVDTVDRSAASTSAFTFDTAFFLVAGVVHQTDTVTGNEVAQGSTVERQTTSDLNVVYLDLRYKWMVYQKVTQTLDRRSVLPGDSVPLNMSATGVVGLVPAINYPSTVPLHPTLTYITQADTVITLNGDELDRQTVTTVPRVTLTAPTLVGPPATGLPETFTYFFDYRTWFSWGTITTFNGGGLLPNTGPSLTLDVGTCTPVDTTPATAHIEEDSVLAQIGVGMDPSSVWTLATDTVGDARAPCNQQLYGSWQTFGKAWAYSQAMPQGDNPALIAYAYKNSAGKDFPALLNVAGSVFRFHPIYVLPTVQD